MLFSMDSLLTLAFSCGLVLNCKNKVWSWQSARWVNEKWRVGPGILGVPSNRLNDKNKIKITSALQKIPCAKQFKETRQGFKGPSTLFSGRKRKCWSFKEHLQNHLLQKQRKTSPQMKWNSHGHSWLSQDRFPSNYALISLGMWRLQGGFPLPPECCQAASLLKTGVKLLLGSAGAQEPSEHLRGVSLDRRAMSLHQRQRWDSCCQFSLLTSS